MLLCQVWFLCLMAYQLFLGYLMPKPFSKKKQYYLTHNWEDKRVHTFPKGICPKVNIIARLENELSYYDSAIRRFNHYTTRTPPLLCQSLPLTILNSIILHLPNYIEKIILLQIIQVFILRHVETVYIEN